VKGDADLVAGNIAQGVNLFGVVGTLTGGSSTYNAGVPDTGQRVSYADYDDGYYSPTVGIDWPNPRFTDNGNGTVTDNLTGLIWLKDADCLGETAWTTALTNIGHSGDGAGTSLNSGKEFSCDSYTAGTHNDWRLPNVRELHSLIDFSQPTGGATVALPSDHPFTGVRLHYYWSSSADADRADVAWLVYLGDGSVLAGYKTSTYYVWPVRGGQ
jgi:hypothetical protein